MLITTWTGVLANTDHTAYVALRAHPAEHPGVLEGDTRHHTVLLFLASGDAIVAAGRLTRDAAEFLRREIGRAWAAGEPSLDVHTVLHRQREGASFAEGTDAPGGLEVTRTACGDVPHPSPIDHERRGPV